jgi:Ribulose bisphosphate carboxylase, small chain
LFGCNDSSQVLREIQQCTRAFPDSYIRLVAFDNKRQVIELCRCSTHAAHIMSRCLCHAAHVTLASFPLMFI